MDLLHDDAVNTIGEYAGKLYGADAYVRFAQTCHRMRQLLLPPDDPANAPSDDGNGQNRITRNVIRFRSDFHAPPSVPRPASDYFGIDTPEQLAAFERWSATRLAHDNRIEFPFASTEVEPSMHDRVLQIVTVMDLFPRASMRLDSHCGSAAPSGISTWFSRARGIAARDAVCGYDGRLPRSVDESRVRVVAWGKRITRMVARMTDHPFQDVAGEGRGWVEVYLEVPGRGDGDEAMVLPKRHGYYGVVGSPSGAPSDSEGDEEEEEEVVMF